jgi:hypothetical protein
MGATAFQRRRRELAALAEQEQEEQQEEQQEKGYEETKAEEEAAANEAEDAKIRAKAKELGIKSYHLKKIETLKEEIAELTKE